MKIIFLDIDGVVCTDRTRFCYFDPICMRRLNTILERTGAKIVVTSTWRKGLTVNNLKELFCSGGDRWGCYVANPEPFDGSSIIGKTPSFSINEKEEDKKDGKPFGRGSEIDFWLDNAKKNGFEIDSYIVLDDDSYDIPPHMDRLVKTDSRKGIRKEDVKKAIDLLIGEEE